MEIDMPEILKPFYNPGPGDIIKDAMKELGWNQEDLAEILGISLKSVNLILNNRQRITPEIAGLLGNTFSTSAEMWLNLDAAYRLRKLDPSNSRKQELTAYKAKIRKIMPVAEMKKKGWFINDISTVAGIKTEYRYIFGSEDIQVPDARDFNKKFCARQTKFDFAYTPAYCNTWFGYAQYFAGRIRLKPYNKSKLESIAKNLGSYTLLEDGIKNIISDLNSCGVGFFVLSHLQKTYLDGAAFISQNNPFIVYTVRYDRVDNFWFVLAHEIAHILLHFDVLTKPLLDNMDSEAESKREYQADKKAAELLSSDKIIREGTRDGQYLTQRRLSDISSKVGISIPVVLGILQHAKIIEWRKFAKCRQPVKDMIPADLIMG